MISSGSSWPWKLTHISIIGLNRLVNSSKINFLSQTGVLFWCRLNRATFFDTIFGHWNLRVFDQTRDRNGFLFFWRVKKNISRKKSHHVSMLSIGYLWEEYEKFWFFIMCHDWLNVSGHSLLTHATYAVFTLGLKHVCSKHVKQTTFPVNLLNLWSLLIMIVGAKCWNSKVLLQIAS